MTHEQEVLEKLKQFDTPSVTNVVATYPGDMEYCLGLYHPWNTKWYTDETLKCMYPELGRLAGHVVTVTFGLPDPKFSRLGFVDLYKAIEKMPKPVIVAMKQDLPEEIKKKNGLCGGNMMTAFKSLGVIGVISDGPSRDLDEVRPMGMQYMLTGVCAGHGEFSIHAINTPVDICGMEVAPGDIVHMDENGAVKFPAEYLDEVAERCERLQAYETKKQKLLAENHDAETLAKILSDNYE
ncbi:RraA family protein [Qiania dongpingensis]|uniref:Putative 4-hydroxy-4-methyl-2-oxoglutarate aldolase n=1 Tax=Qiania dongpingensis TaxID=2763669 RepID=A0A7G9G225_9FIRM|nr:RraA family protein [Qiania dongpingensis]QNM04857.1 RraA family protein [Qiania dongpingensis]